MVLYGYAKSICIYLLAIQIQTTSNFLSVLKPDLGLRMEKIVHKSEIPFHITKQIAYTTFIVFLIFDVLFVLAYLLSTLPQIRDLTVSHRLAFIDLDTEANLPTNYAILKLYFSSLICVLMVFWYRHRAPVFWKIAAIVLFIIGLDESAQLHELWGAGIATKLFGTEYLSGNQYTIFPYTLILGTFYLSSLTLFPKLSKTVFCCFVLSGVFFILSQAAEWSFDPAMEIMLNTFKIFSAALDRFDTRTLMFSWEEGLEMVGYSLLCGGVIIGVYAIQKKTT